MDEVDEVREALDGLREPIDEFTTALFRAAGVTMMILTGSEATREVDLRGSTPIYEELRRSSRAVSDQVVVVLTAIKAALPEVN